MVVKLIIQSFGEDYMNRRLLQLADRSRNMQPVFDLIHQDFMDIERRQFEGEGVGPSGSWAPLADSTLAAKERLGITPSILQGATGDLMRSLTTDDGDSEYRKTANSATFGSTVPYGIFHQSRGARSGPLPRRPPIDLTETTRRNWMRMLQSYLVGRRK